VRGAIKDCGYEVERKEAEKRDEGSDIRMVEDIRIGKKKFSKMICRNVLVQIEPFYIAWFNSKCSFFSIVVNESSKITLTEFNAIY